MGVNEKAATMAFYIQISFLTYMGFFSILFQNGITDFQDWAGDLDYDNVHSIFDLLQLSDLLED